MSRVNQVIANNNTIVKKIVVGTPVKTVTPSGLFGVTASNNQILVYDSAQSKFVAENLIDNLTPLIDSAYISSRVDPNQVPAVQVDSSLISSLVDSAYIALRTPVPGIDSAAVETIIDSAYVSARATGTVDSAAVQTLIDSSYINTKFPALSNITINDSGNGLTFSKTLVPLNNTISLGTAANPFKDLFLSSNSLIIGTLQLSEGADGNLAIAKVDSSGTALPTKVSYNLSDSHIQSINSFVYNADSNRITIGRTGQADLSVNVNTLTDPTINGSLKGPAEFVIDPLPFNDVGGRVTIKGRLTVEGDEFITNATTVSLPNAKTLALGSSFDSAVDANNAGITVGGANTFIKYNYVDDRWFTNKPLLATSFIGKYLGFDSDLASKNTDGLPEGATNLYFTNTRSDTRINTVVDSAYIQLRQSTVSSSIDSSVVVAIVASTIDSSGSSVVGQLLSDLDSARGIITSVVDSDYISGKFAAVGGEITTVAVEPAATTFIFEPTSSITILEDSDKSGALLSYSPTNVEVHKNGLKLVKGVDFSLNQGTQIFLTQAVDSGDRVVIDTTRRQTINFFNALVDSSELIPSTAPRQFDIFDKTAFRFVKYTITAAVTVGVTNKYQASELLVTHNDTEAFFSEYGIVQTQDSSLGEVSVSISGSNVSVNFDPTYTNTTVKFSKNSL